MKVGTIETIEEKPKKHKFSSGLRNRSGSGSGDNKNRGGGGDSNGGDNKPDNDFYAEIEYPSNRFRIGMWFLLLVVLMTFGGLIGAYIVISTNGVLEWKPFDLPKQIWFSTALLVASSITYQVAKKAINSEKQVKAKNWLLATTILGGMFIASQLSLWIVLVSQGVYMASNPYAGFFYIITAVHAIHVIGGIIALSFIVLRTWQPTSNEKELENRKIYASVIGTYWHFMDGLWLVLVGLLGLWK
jgi:cytochrome c oxidase subunit 3